MAAARTGIKAATNVAKTGFKATLVGVKTAVKTNAKAFAKAAVKSYLKSQVKDPKNIVFEHLDGRGQGRKEGHEPRRDQCGLERDGRVEDRRQFDYTMLMSLDPPASPP
jgi:ribosomal protein L21